MPERSDGRGHDVLRPVVMTANWAKYAEGSCLIEMGDTKVLCTASVEEGVPPFRRDTGAGWVTGEYGMLPRSCATRTPRPSTRGKVDGRATEIQRLIGRALRAVVNMDALGEYTIWIDCDVLQADGGTRTAAISGSYVALAQAIQWMQSRSMITTTPLTGHVAAVSVGIVDGQPVLDLPYAEDSRAEVDMNVVMTDGMRLIEVQGTGEKGTFSRQQMSELLDLAERGIHELFGHQDRVLAGSGT